MWPGQRLEISSRDSITKDGTFILPGSTPEAPKKVAIDWKYVYWLERREAFIVEPLWGEQGWFYPNCTDHATEKMRQMHRTAPQGDQPRPPPQVCGAFTSTYVYIYICSFFGIP